MAENDSVRAESVGIFSAFGWPEEPRPAERCPQPECAEPILPTDLYCGEHDRFLPFAGVWRKNTRSSALWILAALVYAGFALTGDLDSWLPAFLAAGLMGLCAVALPLRNFRVTATVVIALWGTAMTIVLVYHFAAPHAHAVIVAALLVTAGCALALHAGFFAVVVALDGDVFPSRSERPRPASAIALAAGILVVAGTAVVTFLAFLVTPMPFPLDETSVRAYALDLAMVALAAAAVAAVAAGLVDGMPRVSAEAPSIGEWSGFAQRDWTVPMLPVEYRTAATTMERIDELVRRASIRLRNALLTILVTLARATVNLLSAVLRTVVNLLIHCVDFVVAAVHILALVAWEAMVSAVSILLQAARIALAYIAYALVVLGLPLLALGAAAGILPGFAGEIRHYLAGGSLTALAGVGLLSAAGLSALTVAWILLAGQRVGKGLESAGGTAKHAAPPLLVLIALGGWIIGLPGTLGYGRVHLGWVTIVSTVILVAALVGSRLTRRPLPGAGVADGVAEAARPAEPR